MAFTVNSTVRAQRQIRRNTDREHRKLHVPLVNREAALNPERDYPPPPNVVVMGPPGCGKTTLIRSLVKPPLLKSPRRRCYPSPCRHQCAR